LKNGKTAPFLKSLVTDYTFYLRGKSTDYLMQDHGLKNLESLFAIIVSPFAICLQACSFMFASRYI